jgi:hypothetical protein
VRGLRHANPIARHETIFRARKSEPKEFLPVTTSLARQLQTLPSSTNKASAKRRPRDRHPQHSGYQRRLPARRAAASPPRARPRATGKSTAGVSPTMRQLGRALYRLGLPDCGTNIGSPRGPTGRGILTAGRVSGFGVAIPASREQRNHWQTANEAEKQDSPEQRRLAPVSAAEQSGDPGRYGSAETYTAKADAGQTQGPAPHRGLRRCAAEHRRSGRLNVIRRWPPHDLIHTNTTPQKGNA